MEKYKEQRLWKKKHDSENLNNVSPYKYKHEINYIKALRNDSMKKLYDPNNEFKNIRPEDFDDSDDYAKAINKAKREKKKAKSNK